MEEDKKGFSQILKATSLFGGVQLVTILFSIIRTKFAAVLLGPSGMGIVGLISSTIDFFGAATNFGISTAGVRSLAEVSSNEDEFKTGRTISIVKNLVWITGLLGLAVLIIFSPFLSEWIFGNSDFTWGFVALSITLLLNQLLAARMVLIQGMRRISLLALIFIVNAVASVVITVPLYYFLGEKGIVPALILISLSSFLVSLYFSKRVPYLRVKVGLRESLLEGKGMLKLGFFIGLSGLLTLASAYSLRIFINNVGTLEDVGLYNAGFAIINTYVGLVFTAMATDYFPRLSSVIAEVKGFSLVANQQLEIAILLLGPILCWFIIFINPIIVILYSEAFRPINEMLLWSGTGMIFKGIGWCLGYIILAKGSSRFFFTNELIALIYQLFFNLIGYYLFGLKGLGISFLIGYVIYAIQVMVVSRWRYGYEFEMKILKKFLILFFLIAGCMACFYFLDGPIYQFGIGTSVCILASIYTFRELDKSTDLLQKAKQKIADRFS
ncbi:oligosaccharide flippase family protein [Algoriphagus antarcticus]|uniref:O-antigen/teichoic acid export membrane protein n=1 Tax=Algoriphagus antarcticus TaxID=238540 RepID=A0A3E0E170_9BACT|nr:oligosaccharide flippase family protein [Algoriphagus antarcticus]REG91483.1 O-antigen/teichoic acid export membrane protein [Algoriphagus antarcticus]